MKKTGNVLKTAATALAAAALLAAGLAGTASAYPDKPIVITEVGWPSNGRTRLGAVASPANQARFLRRFLAFERGIPSHDTFGRVFGLLDPAQLEACFAAWVQSLTATLQKGVVAVDGKVARESYDQARSVSPLHLVSAWVDETRLVLGQQGVEDRSTRLRPSRPCARCWRWRAAS